MAVELVGGAFLNGFLNVLFDRMATSEFMDLLRTGKLDRILLQKLNRLLKIVDGVLYDAENKEISDTAVKNWLDELRDAAYAADDLLDLIAYEAATTGKDEADLTTGNKIRDLFSFRNPFKKASLQDHSEEAFSLRDVPQRMEDIVKRLEELVQKIGHIGLREGAGKNASKDRETSSLVDESEVFGRDADRKAILTLLQKDDAGSNRIEVIPIVGMGGIGKTTLAQLIYNDKRVEELFECKIWVWVSDNCDIVRVKRDILQEVNNASAGTSGASLQQIDVALQKSLEDKKYLLVLDDIWDDASGHWEKLRTPLKSGKRGSKILITTRNQKIASSMCTIQSPYDLRTLGDDSCWQIFEKHVFKGEKGDQRLESTGRMIARKCGGLPLAAKMLACLLCGEQDEAEWQAILESETWQSHDKILPALRLSYLQLPSLWKQCFAYCAIFPKGYKIRKEEIIQLWMAEGFLVPPTGEREAEKMGEKCLKELVSRYFFQKHEDQNGGSYFFMHDLINDLARLVSGEFLTRMDQGDSREFNSRNRYVSFSNFDDGSFKTIDKIHKAKFLLSFCSFCFFPVGYNGTNELEGIADKAVNKLVSHLRCLRVLSLSNFHSMTKLPDSIEHLKHLRYLNLARTALERLPEGVCTLYNLQTLILNGCNYLVELPESMGELINLHCVDIRGASRLQKMPPGMGNLKHLVTLSDFILGKEMGSDINELEKLQHLRGKLSVLNLQNVVKIPNNILKNKKELEYLKLEWNGVTEDTAHELRVLEQLQPYTSVKKLSIHGYGGTAFADWVGHSSYTNLVSLKIAGCKNCFYFPPLGSLSSLKRLSISKFDAVVEVSMKMPFKSLKTLLIQQMGQWEVWSFCEENDPEKCGSLTKLKNLEIIDCPKLNTIFTKGPTHMVFDSLNSLIVKRCPNLKISSLVVISNFNQISNLQLAKESKPSNPSFVPTLDDDDDDINYPGSSNPSFVPTLDDDDDDDAGSSNPSVVPTLDDDDDDDPGYLSHRNGYKFFPSPHDFSYSNDCNFPPGSSNPSFVPTLDDYYYPPGYLSYRNDYDCNFPPYPCPCYCSRCLKKNFGDIPIVILKQFPSAMYGLFARKLALERIEEMGIALNALEHVAIGESDLCGSIPLEVFPALKSLYVGTCKNLKCLSVSGEPFLQPLTNLTHLKIYECENLKSLPDGMHVLPSSLRDLKIELCKKLESFPEGGLPANLKSLDIVGCDELIGRRQQWGLQRFNAIWHLTLGDYEGDDLGSFPEEWLLPSTLTTLEIRSFPKLAVINYNGLQHPTSLSKLVIVKCPSLQCLPEEGLPSSLSSLTILDCPSLKKTCEREKGQDWPKISHIKTVEFDYVNLFPDDNPYACIIL